MRRLRSGVLLPAVLSGMLASIVGCRGTTTGAATHPPVVVPRFPPPKPTEQRRVVAITAFQGERSYWQKLSSLATEILGNEVLDSRQFRVMDYTRLKQALQRQDLSESDLFQRRNAREAIRKILLNDYFITGNITAYGITAFNVKSAMKRDKIIEAKAKVVVKLIDAETAEVIPDCLGSGLGVVRQTIGGAVLGDSWQGTHDATLGAQALEMAIHQAVVQLVRGANSVIK